MTYRTFDGTSQVETLTNGRFSSDGTQYIADSEKINVGTGNDLQIYHDGTNSYIEDAGTGELRLRGTNIRLSDHDGSETFGVFNDDGAVELYHNNVKKLDTTANGIEVTGLSPASATIGTSTKGHYFEAQSDDSTNAFEVYQQHGTNTTRYTIASYDNRTGSKSLSFGVRGDGLTVHGGAITFNSETASANQLDDYEEGSWTPAAAFGGGTTGIAYTTQSGTYTKIGRQVTIHFILDLSNKGSDTGTFTLTGLPFATADLLASTTVEANGIASYWNNIGTNCTTLMYWVNGSTLNMSLTTAAADNPTTASNSDFDNDTSLRGTVTYFTT